MVAQLMLRGFRHPTNRLDEILNRPLHVAEERVGEAIEMMIPGIRTCMAAEPAEEVNEKLPAVLGLLIGVGMHWPHLPGCMYSLGKHALGRLKRVLAQTDLTVDLMQEAVAGQCAMTLPGFAVVVLAVEPCAQLLLVAIVQARLVALVARRRADGVGVGDLVGHEASSTVLLDGATDALDGAVGGPCCASAQGLGHVGMRQQSLGRKVFEGALSHTGLASAHDLHHAAAFVLLILVKAKANARILHAADVSEEGRHQRLGLPAFLARHSPEADLERLGGEVSLL